MGPPMSSDSPTIAITGANGFIGTNLVLRLKERGCAVRAIARDTPLEQAENDLAEADVIFHLAAANRPRDDAEFMRVNRDYSAWLADAVAQGGRRPLIVYSSSAKTADDSEYGRSKRAGEEILLGLAATQKATVSVWRLPNVFGKWARPNYNSAVATFCYNAGRGEALPINDPAAPLSLLHIDDLVDQWLPLIADPPASGIVEPRKVYDTTVGKVADLISSFAEKRERGMIDDFENGLGRALYSTFIAALPIERASYALDAKADQRGSFVEVLKTAGGGQFSYFTALPGATRGGHYHHGKVEKFVVAHGIARFRFRHVLSGEQFELTGSADEPRVIETIPGWAHDVTNIGDSELVVISWANELFDPERPDTIRSPL
jgi:UDP-2-acetamido-2,6-beta-L-arabino-hexul-4-ose reductase